MAQEILVGTGGGLGELADEASSPVEAFAGRSVTALALDGATTWAIVDGSSLWVARDRAWKQHAAIDGLPTTCVAATAAGPLIGTEQAHLLRLTDGGLARVDSFERVDGRQAWYTPWGDPADGRSIAFAVDGTIHFNVHVCGAPPPPLGGARGGRPVALE